MKPVASRVRTAVKAHALDWITAALAATAVALFVLAMARAAGADTSANDASKTGPAAAEIVDAKLQIERRLHQVAGDFGYYVESLERVFERDMQDLEKEVAVLIEDYELQGDRRDFDRRFKSLEVRLDQLAKRIDRLGTTMPLPRELRAY